MNLVCTTGLEQGASLKAECPGRCQDVEFSGFARSSVIEKEKKIAMTTLGTWGLTSKKSFGKRGRICGEVGWSGLLEIFAQSQVCSWKLEKVWSVAPS